MDFKKIGSENMKWTTFVEDPSLDVGCSFSSAETCGSITRQQSKIC
jgi:hypothetical protein